MFRDDLLSLIRRWRDNSDRVILMMDANESVLTGPLILMSQLSKEDIDMREAVHSVTQGPGPRTCIRGKESISGIWVSPEIEVIAASYLPFHVDIGDHRPVMVNVTMALVLGHNL